MVIVVLETLSGGNRPEIGGIVVCAPMQGVQRIQHLARGKKLAPTCKAFSAPGARAVRGITARKADHRTRNEQLPYLDRRLLPLAVALPRLLEQIEAELAGVTASAIEK
jgi:hypothetical protein